MQRREFIKTAGVAAGLSALAYRRVLGANERIRLGIIGAGGRGRALWEEFLKQPDVAPAAVCDVYEPFRDEAISMAKASVPGFGDFRKLLEAPGVDAVIIATPDHWHALPTIAACEAGKDVYVEKPLSLRVREGRLMLDAARKHKRVVQTGSQQRSGAHYQRAAEIVQSGALGEVCHVGAGLVHNAMPGFGGEDNKLPAGLDWEMWLGPAPYRESLPLPPIYHFRNFWDYSGGQMTNFGAHDLDIVRLVMNATSPEAVAGFGRRFVLNDGGETPDVQEVIYQFPNFVVNWSVREMNAGGKSGMFLEFHGTKGTLSLTRSGFEITPEVWAKSAAPKQPQCHAVKDPGSEQGTAHIRNFLDCVKSRERPAADIEQGHLTAVMCHLGNIATRTGKMLRWDPQAEQFIGDSAANEWLQYEYRQPWRLG